jgi:hypothetical protein
MLFCRQKHRSWSRKRNCVQIFVAFENFLEFLPLNSDKCFHFAGNFNNTYFPIPTPRWICTYQNNRDYINTYFEKLPQVCALITLFNSKISWQKAHQIPSILQEPIKLLKSSGTNKELPKYTARINQILKNSGNQSKSYKKY